ncbi:hypothetical protein HK405_004811, partial [Cladochytrium tenue]
MSAAPGVAGLDTDAVIFEELQLQQDASSSSSSSSSSLLSSAVSGILASVRAPAEISYRIPLKDIDASAHAHFLPGAEPAADNSARSPPSSNRQSQDLLTPGAYATGRLRRKTSLAGAPGMLHTDGPWWTDRTGRTLMLRGVNVSGSAKLPTRPFMPSHVREGFFEDADLSFVGRPFPLDEADEHFGRLRRWGFNFLRFNVAWEALEHAGPGVYDYEYMDYVVQILVKAKQYGFRVFIDPHQDVWSRFTGGSGAPGWTLRAAGLDATQFNASYAAIVHNTYHDPANFPKMIWATNYFKLACATMFTLFFGGATFAPSLMVEDTDGKRVNIQDYLQSHYCKAFTELAKRIQMCPGLEDEVVIGYDTLNEPSPGWIGVHDLSVFPESQDLKHGNTPTPFQTLLLGMGFATEVETWDLSWAGPHKTGSSFLNPKGAKAWLPLQTNSDRKWECVWAEHGVWDPLTRRLLKKDYFAKHPATGQKIDFLADFWRVFVHRVTQHVRTVHRRAVIFVEPPVNEAPPIWDEKKGDPTYRIAYAPHWYDGMTLINKRFNRWFNVDVIGYKRGKYLAVPFAIKFGEYGIRQCFKSQIEMLRRDGFTSLGQHPCIMGEIGIPYDMDDRKAYATGDYSAQVHAMDVNIRALEANLINFTLWTYVADNSNEWGDGWNGEDLSIFCRPLPRGHSPGSESSEHSIDHDTPLMDSPAPAPQAPDAQPHVGIFVLPAEFSGDPQPADTQSVQSGNRHWQRSGHGAGSSSSRRRRGSIESGSESSSSSAAGPSSAEGTLADDSADLDVGGRGLLAFARPYPVLTPGTPVYLNFDMASSLFTYVFSHPRSRSAATPAPTPAAVSSSAVSVVDPAQQQPHGLSLAKFLPRARRFSTLPASTLLRDNDDAEDESGGEHHEHHNHHHHRHYHQRREQQQQQQLLGMPDPAGEVEIYVPRAHYPRADAVEVWVSEGQVRWEMADQRLHWRC